jgi:creatinine amidohydrolase
MISGVEALEEFRLERLTYREAENFADMGAVVLLPISPLEAHGPHLPLGVDFFGASTLADMSAVMLMEKDVPVVVAPVLPYALADVAMPFAGTISLKKSTVEALIRDIAGSFLSHGFRGMVVICQHLERPNLAALKSAAADATGAGLPVTVVNPFLTGADKMVALMKGEFPELDLHAGEWETALCLWRFPELVKQDVLQNLPPNWVNLREKLYEQGCRDFVEAGGSQCYFGDPSCATAELGQKIYVALVSALTEEVIEWLAKI